MMYLDNDDSEVVKQGRSFVRREDERLNKKRKIGDGRPVCWYGAKCYRKNSDHLAEFYHPSKEEEEEEEGSSQKKKVKKNIEDEAQNNETQLYEDDEDMHLALKLSEEQENKPKLKKYASEVDQLHELFKSLDKDVIADVLKEAKGDQDKAIDTLSGMIES